MVRTVKTVGRCNHQMTAATSNMRATHPPISTGCVFETGLSLLSIRRSSKGGLAGFMQSFKKENPFCHYGQIGVAPWSLCITTHRVCVETHSGKTFGSRVYARKQAATVIVVGCGSGVGGS